MATTPHKPADNHKSALAQHQEAHAPAKHDEPPKAERRQAKSDQPQYPTLTPANAEALFRNGHRIAKVGDPIEKWISMGRLGDGTPAQQAPMTEEMIEEIKSGEYYLADPGTAPSAPSAAAGPPVVVDAPYVHQEGDLLNCTTGNWQNEPTSYAYQWRREGTNIGSGSAQYVVTSTDVGKSVDCNLTATNAAGSASSASNAITVTSPVKK